MLIYAAIGAFGLLFLLVMLFVGDLFGDHDVDHDVSHDVGGDHEGGGPSFFSMRVMAAFTTAFGVGGVVARYYQMSHPAASGIGVAAGLVMATGVYQFARLLHSQQASSLVRMADLVGKNAEIAVAIPEGGAGQIVVSAGGERSTHIARSADGHAIALGMEVVIQAIRGDSVVVARPGSAPGGSP